MPTPLLAVLIGGGLLACGLALLPRRISTSRSVLIHADPASVWHWVRPFPAFHARHAKLRAFAKVDCCLLRRGDGEESGSLWRIYGRIDRIPYWADLRVIAIEPERRCAVTLAADSLRTEQQVRDHVAVLEIERVRAGLTKATWILEAGLRGTRGRVAALWSRPRLQALLLDQGLRSLKVHVENGLREQAARSAGDPAPVAHPDAPVGSARPPDPPSPVHPS
jgi:hypothetical protein